MIRLLLLAALSTGGVPAPDCSAAAGFKQKGESRTFTTETLFEYMNGNSEGYFAYGFRQMRGVTCTDGKTDLVFDISEMESPDLAWGIFTANRDSKLPLAPLGAAGQVTPRRGAFAKGNLYVEVAANPSGSQAVLEKFLAAWDQRLPGSNKPPALLDVFPAPGLRTESLRLVPESVLGFRMLRRGFVALYQDGKAFVVPESSPDAAGKLLAQFRQRVSGAEPTQLGEEAFQAKDKYLGRLCVFRKGRFLAGATNFPDNIDPMQLAKELSMKLPP
jgi:hypothetical protein